MNPVLQAIHTLVDGLGEDHPDRPVHEITLSLVLIALGDSLLGAPIAEALGQKREASRELATQALRARLAALAPQG
jgi:hypothetical protein